LTLCLKQSKKAIYPAKYASPVGDPSLGGKSGKKFGKKSNIVVTDVGKRRGKSLNY
jgi:hypothetical protein